MSHCISIYLVRKEDIRDEKITNITEDKKSNIVKFIELNCGIFATTKPITKKKYEMVAHIETDYFGGSGYQAATLFINGKEVYSKSSEHEFRVSPINDVLKLMGVNKTSLDEFDTIGLGNYRSNDDFK